MKKVVQHPGATLRRILLEKNITANALSLALMVPNTRIHEIVHERRTITPETALSLARYWPEYSAYFWMSLVINYDIYHAEMAQAVKKKGKKQ